MYFSMSPQRIGIRASKQSHTGYIVVVFSPVCVFSNVPSNGLYERRLCPLSQKAHSCDIGAVPKSPADPNDVNLVDTQGMIFDVANAHVQGTIFLQRN